MLADTEVWRQVAEKIAELRQTRIAHMAAGACATHEEYMRAVGFLDGLKEVEQAADDIFARMTGARQDDRDDDSVGNHYEN